MKRGGRLSPTSKKRLADLGGPKYRTLLPDESDPPGMPMVYATSDGRWMQRWKIGSSRYVERVVRHPDGTIARSRPYRAKRIDFAQAQRRYEAGQSLPAIAEALGCDSGSLSRGLRRRGVPMRTGADYADPIDVEEVLRRYEALEGYSNIARSLGVSTDRVKAILTDNGVDLRKVGHPLGRLTGPKKGPVSYETEFERMKPRVRERSGGRCEARFTERCNGKGEHVHHRKLRTQGGPNTLANLLDTCHSCHMTIHHRPALAYRRNLLLRSWQDPETEPVKSLEAA